jgi:hypothetical protein
VYQDLKQDQEAPNKIPLDSKEELTGKYTDMFQAYIVVFSKELDPGPNWNGQTQATRDRLAKRIRNEWDFVREGKRLSDKWLKSEVQKALINFQHRMGKLIDAKEPKPPEMKQEFWNNLVKKRRSSSSILESIRAILFASGMAPTSTTIATLLESHVCIVYLFVYLN